MKKLLIAALIAVTIGSSAFAASPAKSFSVSETSFSTDFKNASNVTWTTVASYAKATFVLNNVRMEAFYNLQGELIGTSKGITLDELPTKAKRDFAKKFDGYNVKEAIQFSGSDEAAYYISAESEKETVIVRVSDYNSISIIKRLRK